MPAPYIVQERSLEPKYCDVYEANPSGGWKLVLTVWNTPGDQGVKAKIMADRVASLLNQSEYPIGEKHARLCCNRRMARPRT